MTDVCHNVIYPNIISSSNRLIPSSRIGPASTEAGRIGKLARSNTK